MATGHDSVLYERVVLADGQVQWVLIDEPLTSLSTLARSTEAAGPVANNTSPNIYAGASRTVSYTLVVKPSGLSKPVNHCNRTAYGTYDIACNTMI